jgi:hypothetical protein
MTMDPRNEDIKSESPRRLFVVLSPRSLPYARLGIRSLFRNADESFELTLVTDSESDKNELTEELNLISPNTSKARSWRIFGDGELSEREADKFAGFNHLRSFRRGHPCWRKITDPILLSEDRQEMVVLDPDVYFPNRFRFEPTLERGLLLMWQKPSCLLPPEVVENALNAGIGLAHHTDIGVAQWRMPIELDWLNWLLSKIGPGTLPRNMHVESIVWAALAMRIGGGYLNPKFWLCWRRTQTKRLLRKFGATGSKILSLDPFSEVKCFHAGGEAKWWLSEAADAGILDTNEFHLAESQRLPFVRFTSREFKIIQRNRALLKRFGYYSFFTQDG